MEARIQNALQKNIDIVSAGKATLNERFDLYISQKFNLKPTTRENYIYMYDNYVRKSFGKLKIANINYSMTKAFYTELITVRGFKPNSIDVIHSVLHPVFEAAVMDDIITKNHCKRVMKELRESNLWNKEKREALTLEQQKAFTSFLLNEPQFAGWANIIITLLGTGMRVGECTGLVWQNCSFAEKKITVDHTLVYRKDEKTKKCMHRVMFSPKTPSGVRSIPMFAEVCEALLREKEHQEQAGTANTVINGVSGWVFTNRFGTVFTPKSINAAIRRIYTAYNKRERERAAAEGRKPLLLPHITCHILRHSFCTRYCETEGMNVKVLQTIMGHADYETTMDIYTSVSEQFKNDCARQAQGKLFIC